jgi:hypothetical protein
LRAGIARWRSYYVREKGRGRRRREGRKREEKETEVKEKKGKIWKIFQT